MEEAAKGEAKIKLVNAAETESPQKIMINGETATSNLGFGQTTDYIKTNSGLKAISYIGTISGISIDTSLNYTSSITYTTFLVMDRNAKREILNFEDNLSNSEPTKAKVRVLNLSPNFPTGINISVQSGTLFVSALMYKGVSNYFSVDAGNNLRFNVVGSGITKTATALEAGKIYTIWFSGTTSANVEAHVIADN